MKCKFKRDLGLEKMYQYLSRIAALSIQFQDFHSTGALIGNCISPKLTFNHSEPVSMDFLFILE